MPRVAALIPRSAVGAFVIYRTCIGCVSERQPCSIRKRVKASVAGLGITSVKFKCATRSDLYAKGDQVWAKTVDSYDPDGSTDWFPGVVVKMIGSRVVVFIAPDASGEEGSSFDPHSEGFCKIPASRVRPRNTQEEIRHKMQCSNQSAEKLAICAIGVDHTPEYGWIIHDNEVPF
jgi:hypothetical protein